MQKFRAKLSNIKTLSNKTNVTDIFKTITLSNYKITA